VSEHRHILVTGANGQLGMEFRLLENKYPFTFYFVAKDELSVTDFSAITDFIKKNSIDYCINCAAYTAVDKAETETENAFLVNATAVGNIARACKENNTKLFHFSTDYVFDGTADQPYKESDEVSPVNAYGASKLKGEQLALQSNEETIVIRTSWVYSRYGKNFVKTMMKLMKEKDKLSVVSDQRGCPTYAADLAESVMNIITERSFAAGVYHYCNEGIISWFEFAEMIKEYADLKCKIKAITTEEYPTPAKRPGYSALDTSLIKKTFNLTIPDWKSSLKQCIRFLE